MSMEMTGNNIDPQWQLGEIGDVVRSRLEERVSSVSQLTLYMQRNEADLIYGSRLLMQIEAILHEVRRSGLSRDLAVAVESTRPGTISPVTRSILTSNFTKTGQKETVVALESWANAGKIGLIILALSSLIKILGWIMEKGSGFAGDAGADGGEYKEKVDGKVESFQVDGTTVLDQLNITVIKDAYMEAAKGLKGRALENLNLSVTLADEVLSNMKAEEYLNALANAQKGSPFTKLFKGYTDRRQSQQSVIHDLLDTLLQLNVTSGVYPHQAAEKAFQGLPPTVRKAGVKLPNDLNYKQASNVIGELTGYFANLQKVFHALSDPSIQQAYEKGAKGQGLDDIGTLFGQALQTLNGTISSSISDGAGRGFNSASFPVVAIKPDQERDLVGYNIYDNLGSQRKVAVATASAYLNASCLEEMRQKLNLSVGDERELLAVVVSLGKTGFTTNTYDTNLNKYSTLNKAVEQTIKEVEAWQKQLKNSDGGFIKYISDLVTTELKRNPNGLRTNGRELSMTYMDGDGDFFDALKANLTLVKRLCEGVASLQIVLQRSKLNPLVKGNRQTADSDD